MKIDIRWQLLLVVICLGLVTSLLSYQIQGAGLCTTRIPSSGGRLGIGVVGQPDKINPLLGSLNPVDQELSNLIFDGLVKYNQEGYPVPSLAESWSVSDDGRTISFKLRQDVRWHDGQPFTAEDVEFTYSLLGHEAFPAPENLKSFWSSVVVSSTTPAEVSLSIPQPYGPLLDAATIGILPAHQLAEIPVSQLSTHPFNRSPVGTGPFAVTQLFDWEQTGQLRLIPNPYYWGDRVQLDTVDYHFYPGDTALVDALEAGDIQAVVVLDDESIQDYLKVPEIRYFTSPGSEITQLIFNQGAEASPLTRLEQGRTAVALATDRSKVIDRALHGQGLVVDGPYAPGSWAYDDSATSRISHDPGTASAILDELGWVFSTDSGQKIREREGQPLTIKLLLVDEQRNIDIANVLSDQWGDVGIDVQSILADADDMDSALADGNFDIALVQVPGSGDPDLYDFWSQEAIVRGQNFGVWNNRRASEALESGRQLYSVDERRPYYSTFQELYSDDLPAFTMLQHVDTFGLSESINHAEVGLSREPRDRFKTLASWYMLTREVAVSCTEVES